MIASALKGSDTFYCRYDGEAFLSRMATPVVYHSQTVGAVYAYDYDTEQAALLQSFRSNLLTTAHWSYKGLKPLREIKPVNTIP